MPGRLVKAIVMSMIVAAMVAGRALADEPQPAWDHETYQKGWHWPKVKISKETTYFTEPLRPDGGVDYVAALNRLYSKGVTPENNAAVAIWQAAGPQGLDKKIRKRYFAMLGIPELPEKGDYLTLFDDLPEYKEAQKLPDKGEAFSRKAWEQYSAAEGGPWSKEDYPLWATVLEKNEKPLKALTDGLRRPRFFKPLFSHWCQSDTVLVNCDSTIGNEQIRKAGRLLQLRAMFRLGNDISGAWQDTLSLYRLGRLESRSPMVMPWLSFGALYDEMVDETAVMLSQDKRLTASQAREYLKQMQGLPAMQSLGRIYDEGERCYYIEATIIFASVKGYEDMLFVIEATSDGMMSRSIDPSLQSRKEAFRKLLVKRNVDWTEFLYRYNAWYDRLVKACENPVLSKAVVDLTALEKETKRQADATAALILSQEPATLAQMSDQERARHLAELATLPWLVRQLIANTFLVQRCQANDRMAQLAFALAGYRADHDGKYPKALAELAPTYIDVIPKDPFTDAELHYKSDGDGYLVYSVGENGKDDGGLGPRDFPDSATKERKKAWDDISIRTPAKKTERKP